MADIRIDRYEVDVSTNGQTQSITDVGSTSSAFVRLVGSSTKFSGGPIGSTSNADPEDFCLAVQLTATNQLTFYVDTPTGTGLRVMVEVWVYTGSASGAYEFITRQRGSVTVSTGTTNNSASLSGVSDRNAVVPFYTGFTTGQSSRNEVDKVTLACHVDASTNVVFSRTNTGGSHNVTAYYEAVEFTGSKWSVGHGVSSSHDTGNDVDGTGGEVVTLNTASTGTGGSTFDVSDWETAMIVEGSMGGDSAETGLSDCHLAVRPEVSTTQVRFTLDNANSRNDATAYCHVIRCADLTVKRQFYYNLSEGNNTYGTIAVPTGTDSGTATSEAALEWFVTTSGEGTAWARGCLVAQITAMTGSGIQHWVHRSGNTVSASAAIADFSAMTDAGGPSPVTGTGSGTLFALTGSGSGTHTAPVFSGTAAGTLSAIAGDVSGTHIAPAFSGIGVGSLSEFTGDVSGTHIAPAFSGIGVGSLSAVTGDAVGVFSPPVFDGIATGTFAVMTALASGVFVPPHFEGTAQGVFGAFVGEASGSLLEPGVSTAAGLFSAFTGDAEGAVENPESEQRAGGGDENILAVRKKAVRKIVEDMPWDSLVAEPDVTKPIEGYYASSSSLWVGQVDLPRLGQIQLEVDLSQTNEDELMALLLLMVDH